MIAKETQGKSKQKKKRIPTLYVTSIAPMHSLRSVRVRSSVIERRSSRFKGMREGVIVSSIGDRKSTFFFFFLFLPHGHPPLSRPLFTVFMCQRDHVEFTCDNHVGKQQMGEQKDKIGQRV